MHRCDSSSCRDTTWWSGVISSTFKYNGCKRVLHTQNTWVKLDESSICNYFAPVLFERRAYHTRSSRGVSAWRTFAMVHTQGEHLYLEISVKGSSYNATAVLSKIRCIKEKHHMQSKYVTWYGHHHLAPLIFISKVPSWSLSSPAWHHDLYQCVVTWSSRKLSLLQLLLSHSDKVKQLYGACILCNKETTIRLMPVADNFNKTWSSHTTIYSIMPWPYHITTCPAKTS